MTQVFAPCHQTDWGPNIIQNYLIWLPWEITAQGLEAHGIHTVHILSLYGDEKGMRTLFSKYGCTRAIRWSQSLMAKSQETLKHPSLGIMFPVWLKRFETWKLRFPIRQFLDRPCHFDFILFMLSFYASFPLLSPVEGHILSLAVFMHLIRVPCCLLSLCVHILQASGLWLGSGSWGNLSKASKEDQHLAPS